MSKELKVVIIQPTPARICLVGKLGEVELNHLIISLDEAENLVADLENALEAVPDAS